MKVIQVISGNLPIEDTGERRWGAVELIQREYQKQLISHGIPCEIKWLSEVKAEKDTIVHIHVANLCLEAQKMGIPYIYSNHDHTSVHYGKGSWLYNQQLEAIKGSVFSICHAESVINFFDVTDKLFYLPHGVDINFYRPSIYHERKKDLLMIACNGMAGDYGIDRKGFRLGIEAAKKLNLPIMIVGNESNKHFFDIHSDLLEYKGLTIDYTNPKEIYKLRYLQEHKVFLHPSNLEFGSPNLSLLEAYACALPIVGAYDGKRPINGMHVLKALDVDEICKKVQYVYENYNSIVINMLENRMYHDWSTIINQLIKMYRAYLEIPNVECTEAIKNKYIEVYAKANTI